MSGIDVLFQLFALLLGFSIAELLAGLARSWRIQVGATRAGAAAIRIGGLVPLLALLVLIDQTRFWLMAHHMKGAFSFDYMTLLGILFIVGGYYTISTFVFPDDPEHWPDFDEYYFKIRRTVAVGMVAINCAIAAYAVLIAARSGFDVRAAPMFASPVTLALAILYIPGLVLLARARSPRANLALLALMNLLMLTEALAQHFGGGRVAPV